MKRKDFSTLKLNVQLEKDTYFKHEDFSAGIPPFLRGIHTTMYFHTSLKTNILNQPFPVNNTAPEIELANFLKGSFTYIQNCKKESISFDKAVSEISFQTTLSENYFDEIAKIRAARMLWAKMIKTFNPKNQHLLALKVQAIINKGNSALPAIYSGCQSIAAKETNYLFYEEEIGILKIIDPWAGSSYLEKQTEEIAMKAWSLFKNNS